MNVTIILLFKNAPSQYTDQRTGLLVPVKLGLGSYTQGTNPGETEEDD